MQDRKLCIATINQHLYLRIQQILTYFNLKHHIFIFAIANSIIIQQLSWYPNITENIGLLSCFLSS